MGRGHYGLHGGRCACAAQDRGAGAKSLFEMYDYFGELMRERRRQPQADLISALTRVEEQGDVLSEEDLIGLCDQLLTAVPPPLTAVTGYHPNLDDREWNSALCGTRTNYRSFGEDPV